MGLRVEYPQGFQRQVKHLVGEPFRRGRCRVQDVADSGCGGRELLKHRPRWISCARSRHPFPGVAQQGPPHISCEAVAGGQGGDCS